MKRCFKCKKLKEKTQFYKHKTTSDGLLGKCKICTKKDVQKRYENPVAREKIREYERLRFKNPERKRKLKEYQIKRRIKYKRKNKARNWISNAIRDGRIQKKPCEKCGKVAQAHHTDYRKSRQVKWLCFKHHREEHGQKIS